MTFLCFLEMLYNNIYKNYCQFRVNHKGSSSIKVWIKCINSKKFKNWVKNKTNALRNLFSSLILLDDAIKIYIYYAILNSNKLWFLLIKSSFRS